MASAPEAAAKKFCGIGDVGPLADRGRELSAAIPLASQEGRRRGIDSGKIAVRKLVGPMIGLARFPEQPDLLLALGANREILEQPAFQGNGVLGADFLDAIALIDAQRGMRIAQPRHGQRLQEPDVRIVGILLDRFPRPLEQGEHVAASQRVVELPTNVGTDQFHELTGRQGTQFRHAMECHG